MGTQTMKEDGVLLRVLVKRYTPEKVRTMLERAYTAAVGDAMNEFKAEARGYTKKIMDAWNAGNTDNAIKIRDSMPVYLGFDEKSQRVTIAVGVEHGMRQVKDAFVSYTMDVLNSCMFGIYPNPESGPEFSKSLSFNLDLGDESPRDHVLRGMFRALANRYPALLGPRLAEKLAIKQPSDDELTKLRPPNHDQIPFDKARIRDGALPIVIETRGDTIHIGYAPWIAIATRKDDYGG